MRAVVATRYPGTTAQAFYDEVAAGIGGHMLGVFVGFDDGAPRALAIVQLPWSTMMFGPVANLVYSEVRALSVMIGERVREWVRKNGHDRVYGMNIRHGDDVFCRAFRHVGKPSVIGSVVEVAV